MANRTSDDQSFHDQIIRLAANRISRENYNVHLNPNKEHNAQINSLYPDIIVTSANDRTVNFIIEIETINSVTDEEATEQWKPYSLLRGTFILLVPAQLKMKTQDLCSKYNIVAKILTYFSDWPGQFRIDFELS